MSHIAGVACSKPLTVVIGSERAFFECCQVGVVCILPATELLCQHSIHRDMLGLTSFSGNSEYPVMLPIFTVKPYTPSPQPLPRTPPPPPVLFPTSPL